MRLDGILRSVGHPHPPTQAHGPVATRPGAVNGPDRSRHIPDSAKTMALLALPLTLGLMGQKDE